MSFNSLTMIVWASTLERIYGLDGKYTAVPVEYKRDSPKEENCDRIQLYAQSICLEEMICCNINEGYLYYCETRRRSAVPIDKAIKQTYALLREMHNLYDRRYTPNVKRTKACNACSLKNICLPDVEKLNASGYIRKMLEEEI